MLGKAFSPKGSRRHRDGFTLVELLVVIAVIGVLISLLLPAVQSAREAARRTTCRNQLRQLGLGLLNYHDSLGSLPSGYLYRAGPEGNHAGFGWGALTLPFVEQVAVHREFQWDVAVWEPPNLVPRMRHLPGFLCPSDDRSDRRFVEMGDVKIAMGCYVASFGPGDMDANQTDRRGTFSRDSRTRLKEITDGTAQTFLAGERINGPFRRAGAHGVHVDYETTWAGAVREITDYSDDHGHMVMFQTGHTPNSVDSDDRDISAPHFQGAHFLLADGSVHFLTEAIAFPIYQALSTRAGEEAIELTGSN